MSFPHPRSSRPQQTTHAQVELTGAVAHPPVADDVVTVQDAERVDLLGEVVQEGALAGLELLHGQQLARVVPQGVVAAQLHAAKVPLGAGDEENVEVPGYPRQSFTKVKGGFGVHWATPK